MSRRKILNVHLTDPSGYPPSINASRLQAAEGHEVHVQGYYRGFHRDFVAGPGIQEHYFNELPGAWHSNLFQRMVDYIEFRRKLVRLANSIRPDVIIAHDFVGYWGAIPLLDRFPVLLHVHDMPTPGRKFGDGGRLGAVIVSQAAARIGSARAVIMPEMTRLRTAQAHWNIQSPCFFVPNCSRRSLLTHTHILEDLIHARGGSKPEVIITRAGGAGSVHMIEESVQALRYLPEAYHLCLIGCGDDTYQTEIRQNSLDWGVAHRLHQFSFLNYDDCRGYIRSSTVGLATYRQGVPDINKQHQAAASDKYMEYLAAGIPIIALDRPDFRALADQTGGTAFVQDESPESLARTILEVCDNSGRHRTLSAEAFQAHWQEFNYEQQYQPVLEFIENLTSGDALRCP